MNSIPSLWHQNDVAKTFK